jgi:hypothetical protein
MSNTAKLRIEILPAQRFVDPSDEKDPKSDAETLGVDPETDFSGRSGELAIRRTGSSRVERTYTEYVVCSSSGIVQTIRRLLKGNSGVKYFAFSLRPEIVWDENLAARVLRELRHFEAHCSNWLVLSAHGRNLSEGEFVSAHFNYEPDLIPARGRKPVVVTSGLLYVVNIEKFRKYLSHLSWSDEIEETINVAIAMGYLDGTASYFTDRLFPCLLGRRNLSLTSSAMWIERVAYLIHYGDSPSAAENRRDFKVRLLNELSPSENAAPDLKLSFVIRTIFNRQHLLHRCLISVEYIRRSLGVPVEIVIASDVGALRSEQNVSTLRESFPWLEFVLADGSLDLGVSRVRNLKAGIKASTGDWVCIIDDDDYYLTHACSVLEKLLEPGFISLLLLNAQIVNEKWTKTTWKYQKEITSYGTVYDSKEWSKIYTGVNALPLSSVVHPGSYIRRVITEYEFRYDLSEDFIFHLLVFSHPSRPAVAVSSGVSVHQSHRALSDNVSTNVDRAGWCLDTGNGLYDLLFEQGRQFEDLSEVGARHLIALGQQRDAQNDREELVGAVLESARQRIVKLKQASIRIGQLEQERDVALEDAKQCERRLEQAMSKASALEQERSVASPLRLFLGKTFRKT